MNVQKKKSKTDNRGCCGSSRTYDVDVPYKEIKSFYEIDLRDTARLVKAKLDEQANINKGLLFRVIDKQVNEDFKNAENQILKTTLKNFRLNSTSFSQKEKNMKKRLHESLLYSKDTVTT